MKSLNPYKSLLPVLITGIVVVFVLSGPEGYSQNTKGDRSTERPLPPTLGVGQNVKSKKIKSRPVRSRRQGGFSARTFRQNKKNLQNNSDRPSSGDRVSVPTSRVQVRSASPRQESIKVTRDNDYLNPAARPQTGDRPTRGNLSASGRRVTPKNNPARAVVIYPQSGALVNNASPSPPRVEKPSSVRLPSSGKGLREPKRADVAWSSSRAASGRKIEVRKPATQQQAWSGNAAGNRLKVRSDQSNARKVFSATNKMVHNKSPKPNLKSEKGLPLRAVRNAKGYTPASVAVTPSKSAPSASATWTGKEKKNVYWGKIFKDRTRITTDLTGGPLRKVDFKSSGSAIASNDTVRSARQSTVTGGFSNAKAPGYKSATKGGRAWSGDLAGKRLRSGRMTGGRGAKGQPLLSAEGTGSDLAMRRSARSKKPNATASGYGRKGKKVLSFPSPKGIASSGIAAAALRQQLMYGALKPAGKALMAAGLMKPAGFTGATLSGKNLYPRMSARTKDNKLLFFGKEKNLARGNLDVRSVPGKTRLAGGTIAMKQFAPGRLKAVSEASFPLAKSSKSNFGTRKMYTSLRPSEVRRSILMHKMPISLRGWTTPAFEKGTPQGITVIKIQPGGTDVLVNKMRINESANRQRELSGYKQRYPFEKIPGDFKAVAGFSGNMRITQPGRMAVSLRPRTEKSIRPVDVSGWTQQFRIEKIPGDFKAVTGYTGNLRISRPNRIAGSLRSRTEQPLKPVDVSGWNQNYRVEKIPGNFKQVTGYSGNVRLTDANRSNLSTDKSLKNPFRNNWVKHPQAHPEALKKRRPEEAIYLTAGLQKDRIRLAVPNKNPDLVNLNYPSEKFNRSVVSDIASYSGKDPQKNYVKNPSGVANAPKVVNPYQAPIRAVQFQVAFRVYQEHRVPVSGAHPDAQFAQLSEDNVKGERSQLSGIKMLWSKTFRKNDLQPSSVKQKIRRPRYDPREVGIWYD